jgi:DNA-binding NarL/FixJ family response regulator
MSQMRKVRTLVADDHAMVRSGISNALRELHDLELVAEASDGPGVFLALAKAEPDLLLIDVAMPDFEPITDIRKIRESYPTMKILVISAHDDDVYVKGLLSLGVDGYHLKDQSLSDLQLAIQRVLSGKKWVSSRLIDKLVNLVDTHPSGAPGLTSRQREILLLLKQGYDNNAISLRMGLKVKTIEKHLTNLYRQLDVQSRLEAVNYAIQHPEVLALYGQTVEPFTSATNGIMNELISILLVDDNIRFRHQLGRMVRKVCPRAVIYEAENIKETMELLQHVSPQLALVDVVLGEENGISCVRRLKALLPQLRVVLISAYPDRVFHSQGLEAGAVALVDKKDLGAATLYQLVEDMISGD